MRPYHLLLASLFVALPCGAALGQTANSATKDASDTQVEEIIVTATRRSTSLQNVPAAIQAVPAAALKAFKVDGVLQLPNLVPGLIAAPSGGNNLYLRGVGSSSTGYNEAQTAVYVDGLYLPNPSMGIYSFNNIERIEVLKGPQGTLYGRNVTAGLIAVTTHDPGETASLDASVGYGNFATSTGKFYGSVPLSDTLAVNGSIFYQKQADGYVQNVFTGNDIAKSKELGVQTKALWKPGEDTRVTANFIYDYNDRNYGYAQQVYPGTLGTDGTPNFGEYRIANRFDPGAPFHARIGSLKIEHDFGYAKLMSMTGIQTSTQDVTFNGAPILGQPVAGQSAAHTYFAQSSRTWSQELQLTSATSSAARFDWVAGAFYFDDITKLQLNSFQTCVGAVCAPGTPITNFGRPTTKSYSVYGDGTVRILDHTRFTVGLRYTDETKRLSGLVTPLQGRPNSVAALPAAVITMPGQPFTGFPNGIPTELKFTKLTYRFVLAQDFTENVHGYISHNLGFKSGAFNGNSFTNPPVNPEQLTATEVGIKSQLFDNRLRLNASYFHYNYKDVQVRSLAPPAVAGNPILLNVARERIKGVDLDFALVPLRGLTINGALEILDGKYADYPGATCVTPGTRVVGGVTIGAPVAAVCNQAGFRIAYAPPLSASLGATYKLDTANGEFTFNVNDKYNSSYPMAAGVVIYEAKLQLFDASIGWLAPNKHVEVQAWGRNLTDRYHYVTAIQSTNFAVAPAAPRTYGLTLGYHF